MASSTASVRVILKGPIFDGRAEAAAKAYVDSIAGELAHIGRDWIRIQAEEMNKSRPCLSRSVRVRRCG